MVLGVGRVGELFEEAVKDVHEAAHQVEVGGGRHALLYVGFASLQLEPQQMLSNKAQQRRYEAMEEGGEDGPVLLRQCLRQLGQPRLNQRTPT